MVLKYESYLEEKKKHDLEMMLLKQGITQELDSVRKEMRHDFGRYCRYMRRENLNILIRYTFLELLTHMLMCLSIVIGP